MPPPEARQGPNIALLEQKALADKEKMMKEKEEMREKLAQEKFSPQSEAEAKRGSRGFVPPEARMGVRY